MLKKHRKQLINASASVAIALGVAMYDMHKTISDTNLIMQEKYDADLNDFLDFYADAGIYAWIIFDIRLYYLILATLISIFFYQTYRYLTTKDDPIELQKDAVTMGQQEKISKERREWQGVGQLSIVPKGLLLMLGLVVLLAILQLYIF